MSTATMKAARFHAAKDIRVEETSIPSVKKNQVKMEVKYVGICGTDLHEYLHGPMIIPMKEPHPLNGHWYNDNGTWIFKCGCWSRKWYSQWY